MSLLFVLLVIVPLALPAEGASIAVANGGRWGRWGTESTCPSGYRAYGFSLKVEDRQGPGDDSALNGIHLLCRQIDNMANLRIISSSEGGWGSWTAYQSCGGDAYLKSFKLRVETDQRVGDDTAANNIMFYCSNGKTLTGHGLTWGTWGRGSSTCHRGICGIKTKVEEAQGWGDDTALNDVRFTCC